METKDILLELRKDLNLSQDEFAGRLFVTRQAVSRWENGETTPNTETLKLIAQTFQVSVDHLLGHPSGQCQSCGMLLQREEDKGTEQNGSKSEEYCSFCFQQGEFTKDISMAEMAEHNLQDLSSWNEENEINLTEQEARMQLMEFLPSLKRWRDNSG